jgi:hypothetical protein
MLWNMTQIKVGDIVRHVFDNERLRVKRIYKGDHEGSAVATCEEIDKGKNKVNIWDQYVYSIRVSHVQNLILDEK